MLWLSSSTLSPSSDHTSLIGASGCSLFFSYTAALFWLLMMAPMVSAFIFTMSVTKLWPSSLAT